MRAIDSRSEAVEDALVAIAAHVPLGEPIGRPLTASQRQNGRLTVHTELDDGSLAFYRIAAYGAHRAVALAGGGIEMAAWRDGIELYRRVESD